MTDPSKNISPNDLSVLNRIFNPSMPHGDVVEEDTSCSSNGCNCNTSIKSQLIKSWEKSCA